MAHLPAEVFASMKLPNFRLYTTQATAGLAAGLSGIAMLMVLMYCVFKGFRREQMVIPFNPESYRVNMVQGLTAASLLMGLLAGVLGFRSMGEKRNTRQC